MENKKKLNVKIIGIIAAVVVVIACVGIIIAVAGSSKDESYRVIKIHGFEGALNMWHDEKEATPVVGMNLKEKDKFEIQLKGQMELLADSDKHVTAAENTDFYISGTGEPNKGKLQFQLTKGTLMVEIENKLNEDEEFEIVTPNAVTSVRGTTFEVSYFPEEGRTSVYVRKGKVEAKSSTTTYLVTEGDIIDIYDDGSIRGVVYETEEPTTEETTTEEPTTEEPTTEEPTTEEPTIEETTTEEPTTVDPIKQVLADGIEEDEFPQILYGEANYSQLLYCIKNMQQCSRFGKDRYVRNALQNIWYSSKINNVYEPISSAGGETYSVAELNELFALMTDEKISADNMPMVATLNGDTITYRPCDVSAGGYTDISEIVMTVNENDEIIVTYEFHETYGSDGMTGAKGTAFATVAPNETGLYVIKGIEEITRNEFNY